MKNPKSEGYFHLRSESFVQVTQLKNSTLYHAHEPYSEMKKVTTSTSARAQQSAAQCLD